MPDYDFFTTPAVPAAAGFDPLRRSTHEPPSSPRARRRPTGRQVLVGAVLLALAGGAASVISSSGPVDRRAVVLPATLLDLPRATGGVDFGSGEQWRSAMAEDVGPHPFAGRGYSNGRVPLANLTVARMDAGGIGDVALAAPPFTSHGATSCTQTFDLGARDEVHDSEDDGESSIVRNDNWMLCWRAGDELTVSVLVLGGDGDSVRVADAVETVWDLQT